MTSATPRVSVIIPCFNLGQFLPEAIESVRRQTFRDVEAIVVDDGSSAPVSAPADVRVMRSATNRGLSAARNLGISHARGEYITCLDADDMFEPEWLDLGVARLDGDSGLGFVSHWVRAFGDEEGDWTPGRSDLAALLDQNVFNGAALFRREIVTAVGGFDESMRDGCEDWEFWIRVMKAGYRGTTIPQVLYRYRRRPDSMSRVMNASDTWFDLFSRIVTTHTESYRTHLLDLTLRREWSIAQVCRGIDAMEEEFRTTLEPSLRERQRELDTARARLAAAETAARVRELDAERHRLQEQVEALHRSWSWRITAPLRRIYEWIARP